MIQWLIILAMRGTQVPSLVGGLRACRPQLETACHSLQRPRVGPQPRAAHVPKLRPNEAENKYFFKK